MPLHDFKCPVHGLFQVFQKASELKDTEKCPKCGTYSRKTFEDFPKGKGGNRIFKPGWFEHIGPEPIYVESRRQLREECEKHNCYSVYLEDSYNR